MMVSASTATPSRNPKSSIGHLKSPFSSELHSPNSAKIQNQEMESPLSIGITNEDFNYLASSTEEWLWLKDEEFGLVAAKVIGRAPSPNEDRDKMKSKDKNKEWVRVQLLTADGGGEKVVCRESTSPVTHISSLSAPADLLELGELSMGALLHTVRQRYRNDSIYSSIGTQNLISVNPYRPMPHLYSNQLMDMYKSTANDKDKDTSDANSTLSPNSCLEMTPRSASRSNVSPRSQNKTSISPNDPHLFRTAQETHSALISTLKPQSIVVSGESGSGKTEATKILLKYLSGISNNSTSLFPSVSPPADSSPPGGGSNLKNKKSSRNIGGKLCNPLETSIEVHVLKSTPILEAFGNAKTLRNDNSSRFGKFIRIYFDHLTCKRIVSAQINHYLLEKCRLVCLPDRERNFHIFYNLMRGLSEIQDPKLIRELELDPKEKFQILGDLDRYEEFPAERDRLEFGHLLSCLQTTGFTTDDVSHIMKILGGILHFSNVKFEPSDLNGSTVEGQSLLCRLSPGDSGRSRRHLIYAMKLWGLTSTLPVSMRRQLQMSNSSDAILDCSLTVSEMSHESTSESSAVSAPCGAADTLQFVSSDISSSCSLPFVPGFMKIADFGYENESETLLVVPRNKDWDAEKSFDISILEFLMCKQTRDPQLYKIIFSPRQLSEVTFLMEAICKEIYSRLFEWLIVKINGTLARVSVDGKTQESQRAIGLLDIYGFEVFDGRNSFEQFCINFANEKLQKHFNAHIFELEQKLYTEEAIDWQLIEFSDNQNIIDALEGRSKGVFKILEDNSLLATGTDQSFLYQIERDTDPAVVQRLNARRNRPGAFSVTHYAGEVIYESKGFVLKNKDRLSNEAAAYIHYHSQNQLVKLLFEPNPDALANKKSSLTNSVSLEFRQQLNHLMNLLTRTTPTYIRCIKPNNSKSPKAFDSRSVLEQLKYAGLLESIRIRKAGFSVRFTFAEFLGKYSILNSQVRIFWISKCRGHKFFSSDVNSSAPSKGFNKLSQIIARGTCSSRPNSKKQNPSARGFMGSGSPTSASRMSQSKSSFIDLEKISAQSLCKVLLMQLSTNPQTEKNPLPNSSATMTLKALGTLSEREGQSVTQMTDWQMGKTKVFLKESVHLVLEKLRMISITSNILFLQSLWRRRYCILEMKYRRQNVLIVQTMLRSYLAVEECLKIRCIIRLQAFVKMRMRRINYLIVKHHTSTIQYFCKQHLKRVLEAELKSITENQNYKKSRAMDMLFDVTVNEDSALSDDPESSQSNCVGVRPSVPKPVLFKLLGQSCSYDRVDKEHDNKRRTNSKEQMRRLEKLIDIPQAVDCSIRHYCMSEVSSRSRQESRYDTGSQLLSPENTATPKLIASDENDIAVLDVKIFKMKSHLEDLREEKVEALRRNDSAHEALKKVRCQLEKKRRERVNNEEHLKSLLEDLEPYKKAEFDPKKLLEEFQEMKESIRKKLVGKISLGLTINDPMCFTEVLKFFKPIFRLHHQEQAEKGEELFLNQMWNEVQPFASDIPNPDDDQSSLYEEEAVPCMTTVLQEGAPGMRCAQFDSETHPDIFCGNDRYMSHDQQRVRGLTLHSNQTNQSGHLASCHFSASAPPVDLADIGCECEDCPHNLYVSSSIDTANTVPVISAGYGTGNKYSYGTGQMLPCGAYRSESRPQSRQRNYEVYAEYPYRSRERK